MLLVVDAGCRMMRWRACTYSRQGLRRRRRHKPRPSAGVRSELHGKCGTHATPLSISRFAYNAKREPCPGTRQDYNAAARLPPRPRSLHSMAWGKAHGTCLAARAHEWPRSRAPPPPPIMDDRLRMPCSAAAAQAFVCRCVPAWLSVGTQIHNHAAAGCTCHDGCSSVAAWHAVPPIACHRPAGAAGARAAVSYRLPWGAWRTQPPHPASCCGRMPRAETRTCSSSMRIRRDGNPPADAARHLQAACRCWRVARPPVRSERIAAAAPGSSSALRWLTSPLVSLSYSGCCLQHNSTWPHTHGAGGRRACHGPAAARGACIVTQ